MHNASPITLDDLSIRYPRRSLSGQPRAVSGITLEVGAGEILALVGPTGSGKSTLARVLAGRGGSGAPGSRAPRIDGGRGSVLGRELRGLRGAARREVQARVGWIPQEAGARLRPDLTVFENVAEPILSRDPRYDARELGERIAHALDGVRISLAALERYPYELSTGQRQRVALAAATILGPEVLIADEPTAGIDATVRGAVRDLLRRHVAEGGAACVVSHDPQLLGELCARVAVLEAGSLVAIAPMAQLRREARSPFIRGLVAAG